jgi:hypothetical protein
VPSETDLDGAIQFAAIKQAVPGHKGAPKEGIAALSRPGAGQVDQVRDDSGSLGTERVGTQILEPITSRSVSHP